MRCQQKWQAGLPGNTLKKLTQLGLGGVELVPSGFVPGSLPSWTVGRPGDGGYAPRTGSRNIKETWIPEALWGLQDGGGLSTADICVYVFSRQELLQWH